MPSRLTHILLAVGILPGLILHRSRRSLWRRMRRFTAELPDALARPLPEACENLTPQLGSEPAAEGATRRLADVAALVARRSPLGLCLRRSLLRYHFLRAAGVPVTVRFGARLERGAPEPSLHGHAWTVVDGIEYHERPSDFEGFTVMLVWPEAFD